MAFPSSNLHFPTLFLALFLCICTFHIASSSTCSPKTFIKNECNSTSYAQLCYDSLSPFASKVKYSRQNLCKAALTVTLSAAKDTSKMLTNMLKKQRSNRSASMQISAIQDCKEEFDDVVDEIRQCLNAIKNTDNSNGSDTDHMRYDLKTWISAALTDETTCMDGVDEANVKSDLKKKIKTSVTKVLKLNSITLSLVNRL